MANVTSIKIEFVNKDSVILGLLRRKGQLGAALRRGAEKSVKVLDTNVKALCPVRTGALKESYHGEIGGSGVSVWIWYGTNGAFSLQGYNYAPIQEFKYRPHLRPGVAASLGDIKECFMAEIRALN